MDPMERISSLITGIVASGIWYVVCMLVSFGVFRRSAESMAFPTSIIIFFIGFAIAAARRNTSVGSAKDAQRKANNFTEGVDNSYRHGTGSINVLHIASFLPDLAIGAFRAFLGLENDEVGFK